MERTNKLFTVTVAIYATMAVEADNSHDAMALARKYKNQLTDRDFEDSEKEIDSCEAYGSTIADMCLEPNEKVYTADGVMTAKEYEKQVEDK